MLCVQTSFAGSFRVGRDVCVCVCPVSAYDVGLSRRDDLRRQLAIDLPRSVVHPHKVRAILHPVLHGAHCRVDSPVRHDGHRVRVSPHHRRGSMGSPHVQKNVGCHTVHGRRALRVATRVRDTSRRGRRRISPDVTRRRRDA